ncbi:MAG: CRISPR-associated RAMP protein Csx10 [Chloroflexi bacterium]|nr:CRISPR-associated RAMP protein Csx10 [Chloroflexota bacterium]
MVELALSVLAVSPLHVGTRKPYGHFLESDTVLPGSLLRGALAAPLLREADELGFEANHDPCPEPTVCPFCYYTAGVHFPFCTVGEPGAPTQPAPRTLLTCKHAPGFLADASAHEPHHGVRDGLLARVAYAELSRIDPFLPLPPQHCRCGASLEPFARRYRTAGRGHATSAPSVPTRRMTRVALNRARETAEPGLLYAVQAVGEGTRFVGRLHLPDEWDAGRVREFSDLLQEVRYLGGGQSRGLGRVEVTASLDWPAEDPVEARLAAFNTALAEQWTHLAEEVAGAPQAPTHQYLSLGLLVPALLAAPDGAPCLEVTPRALAEQVAALGYPDLPPLEQVCCALSPDDERPLAFAAGQVVGGWSAAWQMPKPTALAAAAGSVYLFRASDLHRWHEALEALERHGLGARREEGFGAVRVCDPIHCEVDPL